MHSGIVDIVYLDGYNLLQLLHLLLHLHSLSGLIAEALNEGLHVGNLLLLILISAQLLLTTLTAQHDILVILHPVVDNLAARDFQRTVTNVVDERTVVRHQHHS